MTSFTYAVKNRDGTVVRSTVVAPTRQQALSDLRDQGFTILSLESVPEIARAAVRKPFLGGAFAPRAKIGLGEMAIFCRQLAVAISAGVTLRDALELITDDIEQARLRRVLKRIITRINDGKPFSTAVEEEQGVFGSMFVGLIRVAEEAGSLPETLEQLANYMERTERMIRKFHSITMYPLFIGAFFIIVCIIMTVFIVPQFRSIFAGREANLPGLTQAVFGVNRFILDHALGFSLSLGGGIAAVVLFVRSTAGGALWDRFKLRLPILGKCFRKMAIARVSRNIGLMLRGGVSVTTAIEISSTLSGNRQINKSLLAARDRIVTGSDIAGSFAQDPEFPRLVVRMIAVGESSGQLSEVFDKVADTYESQVETSVSTATTLLEPLLICFFGGIILVLVLAIYLPVFSASTAAH